MKNCVSKETAQPRASEERREAIMRTRAWHMSGLAVVVGLVTAPALAQDLEMRSGTTAPNGEVRGVSFAGVELVETGGALRVISWDQVAVVHGAHASDALAFGDVAKQAWRARVRMERGDVSGAEQLFEQLFVKYRGQTGATAGVVASGLLRCRLSRQAQNAAVEAWLALLATGERETLFEREKSDDDLKAAPIVDSATGLAPQLPPVWIKGAALQVVLNAIAAGSEVQALDRAGKFAALYRISAADEARRDGQNIEPQALMAKPVGDVGLELAWDVVASRFGDDATRAEAVRGLEARVASADTAAWMQAWSRFALGRAMMVEGKAIGDGDKRNLGMVHMLHVPARFSSVSPFLAGLALAEVSGALAEDGEVDEAARVKRAFLDQYPGHPAQAILPVLGGSKVVSQSAGTSAPGTASVSTSGSAVSSGGGS